VEEQEDYISTMPSPASLAAARKIGTGSSSSSSKDPLDTARDLSYHLRHEKAFTHHTPHPQARRDILFCTTGR
jgi:hypothetical protein